MERGRKMNPNNAIWLWYQHIGNPGTFTDAEQCAMRTPRFPERKLTPFQAAWAKRRACEKRSREIREAQEAQRSRESRWQQMERGEKVYGF
jgi:hypothetical protein